MYVIVPDALRAALDAKLDEALRPWPEATAEDRADLFRQLLLYYDETGQIPDFEVKPNLPQAVIKGGRDVL